MNIKKQLVVALLMVFLFSPGVALADGMAIEFDPYSHSWDYSKESNQQAFINYKDGIQKMIISIGIDGQNNNRAVWLFPIPVEPQKITIDVFKDLPGLYGEEISAKVKSYLNIINQGLQASQIYTIPVLLKMLSNNMTTGFTEGALGGAEYERSTESDVSVYEHLEKEGVISEIITAKTADGIYDYLKNKGLKIEKGSIPILNNYIGKNYSFVISWITPPQEYISVSYIREVLLNYYSSCFPTSDWVSCFPDSRNINQKFIDVVNSLQSKYPEFFEAYKKSHGDERDYLESQQSNNFLQELTTIIKSDPSIIDNILSKQKGVFVTFPIKDIYFPLLPTSVYGEKIVPATIRVFGYVSPEIFSDIKNYTKVSYYEWNSPYFDNDLEKFVGKFYKGSKYSYSVENFLSLYEFLNYTKIEINAPSKFLTNDLWISNHAPIKTYYSNFIADYSIFIGIILFILSSVLAGILAGLLVFKNLRNNFKKLGVIGLSNCLTIFALIITVWFFNTKEKDKNIDLLLNEIKQKGYFWKRKLASSLLVVFFPLFLISLFFILVVLEYFIDYSKHISFEEIMFITPFISGAIVSLTLVIILRKIKVEDRELFRQLKFAKYSSWTLQPKDKMKYVFVPVFSVLFIIIAWLLTKLIGFTV